MGEYGLAEAALGARWKAGGMCGGVRDDQRGERWGMVHGAWGMVHGAWCMVHGAWCMVHGARGMVHGAWCTGHGARGAHPKVDVSPRHIGAGVVSARWGELDAERVQEGHAVGEEYEEREGGAA